MLNTHHCVYTVQKNIWSKLKNFDMLERDHIHVTFDYKKTIKGYPIMIFQKKQGVNWKCYHTTRPHLCYVLLQGDVKRVSYRHMWITLIHQNGWKRSILTKVLTFLSIIHILLDRILYTNFWSVSFFTDYT